MMSELISLKQALIFFNSLDIDNDMQLLILNRRVESNSLSSIRYDLVGDGYDDYRKEYNAMINDRFSQEQKYLTK